MGRKRTKESAITWGNIGLTTKEDKQLFARAKAEDCSVRKHVRKLIQKDIEQH